MSDLEGVWTMKRGYGFDQTTVTRCEDNVFVTNDGCIIKKEGDRVTMTVARVHREPRLYTGTVDRGQIHWDGCVSHWQRVTV